MKKSHTHKSARLPNALSKFLDEIDVKVQQDGYPPDIMRNMRQSPEMMAILMKMIASELATLRHDKASSSDTP